MSETKIKRQYKKYSINTDGDKVERTKELMQKYHKERYLNNKKCVKCNLCNLEFLECNSKKHINSKNHQLNLLRNIQDSATRIYDIQQTHDKFVYI